MKFVGKPNAEKPHVWKENSCFFVSLEVKKEKKEFNILLVIPNHII